MQTLLSSMGRATFWLCWPLYVVYFRLQERTRVLVVHGEYVLVVRHWIGDGKWSLPGGGLHRRENPTTGALRELREEVGMQAESSQLEPLGLASYRAHGHYFVFHRFTLPISERPPALQRQRHEIAAIAWVPWRELNIRNAGPDVLSTLEAWLRH